MVEIYFHYSIGVVTKSIACSVFWLPFLISQFPVLIYSHTLQASFLLLCSIPMSILPGPFVYQFWMRKKAGVLPLRSNKCWLVSKTCWMIPTPPVRLNRKPTICTWTINPSTGDGFGWKLKRIHLRPKKTQKCMLVLYLSGGSCHWIIIFLSVDSKKAKWSLSNKTL